MCFQQKIAQAPVIGGWAVPGPIFQEENMSFQEQNIILVGPVPSCGIFSLSTLPLNYYSCCILIAPIILNLQNANFPKEQIAFLKPNERTRG